MRKSLLVALVAVCCIRALHAEEPLCDRSGSKSTPSPDGQWVANVQEETGPTPTGPAAGLTVRIAWASDTARSQRLF